MDSYSNDSNSFDAASTCDSNGISKGKRIYQKRNEEKIRRWSQEECLKYEHFILDNFDYLSGTSSNRTNKIFLQMSQTIGTKTPTQCRSHHQKFFRRVLKSYSIEEGKPNQQAPILCKPRLNSAETASTFNLENPLLLPNCSISPEEQKKRKNNVLSLKDFELTILKDGKVDWEQVFDKAARGNFLLCEREEDFFAFK